MKRILLASLCFLALSSLTAFATDTPAKTEPAKPTCGKTVEECQAKVDALSSQVATLTTAYQAVRQQRDQVQQALSDQQLADFVDAKAVPAAEAKK